MFKQHLLFFLKYIYLLIILAIIMYIAAKIRTFAHQ